MVPRGSTPSGPDASGDVCAPSTLTRYRTVARHGNCDNTLLHSNGQKTGTWMLPRGVYSVAMGPLTAALVQFPSVLPDCRQKIALGRSEEWPCALRVSRGPAGPVCDPRGTSEWPNLLLNL